MSNFVLYYVLPLYRLKPPAEVVTPQIVQCSMLDRILQEMSLLIVINIPRYSFRTKNLCLYTLHKKVKDINILNFFV